jgi:hypothetical protein
MGKKMSRRINVLALMTVCLVTYIAQYAFAEVDWKEMQKQLVARTPVKVGDVIDKTRWENVKDIIPVTDWILPIIFWR